MVSQNLGCKDNTESFPATQKIPFKIDCKSTDLLKPFNFRPKSLCSHSLFYFSSANHNQFKAGTNDRDRQEKCCGRERQRETTCTILSLGRQIPQSVNFRAHSCSSLSCVKPFRKCSLVLFKPQYYHYKRKNLKKVEISIFFSVFRKKHSPYNESTLKRPPIGFRADSANFSLSLVQRQGRAGVGVLHQWVHNGSQHNSSQNERVRPKPCKHHISLSKYYFQE